MFIKIVEKKLFGNWVVNAAYLKIWMIILWNLLHGSVY